MEALIFAAGLGSRMGELTQQKPKCLVEISGQPILGYILAGLVEVGIQRVIIAVERWHEQVASYVGTAYPHLSVVLPKVPLRGLGFAAYSCRDFVDRTTPLLLTVGDLICQSGYSRLYDAVEVADLALAVSSAPVSSSKTWTWASSDHDGRLSLSNCLDDSRHARPLLGLYAVRPVEAFFACLSEAIEKAEAGEMSEDDIQQQGIRNQKGEYRLSFAFSRVGVSPRRTMLVGIDQWLEINTPLDIDRAEKEWTWREN